MSTSIGKKRIFDPLIDPKMNSNVNLQTEEKIKMEIEVLTEDQLMKVLSISECTLTALVKQKQIPHYYVGKRNLRFKTEEILNWICNLGKNTRVAS
jgi:excisionase family DNA binding protein